MLLQIDDRLAPHKSDDGTAAQPAQASPQQGTEEDGEFHLTIRKLEVPVRPRGVLAE